MEGLLQWFLLISVGMIPRGAADPCTPNSSSNPDGYVVWDDDGYNRQATDDSELGMHERSCDRDLADHFYRLMHPSGTRLHNSCVTEVKKCGAQYPIWMEGDYPSVSEGLVSRRVCTSYPSIPDCCFMQNTIAVKNCGEFYVFKLPGSLGCDYAYCFANETKVTSYPASTTLDFKEDVVTKGEAQKTETEGKEGIHTKVTTIEKTLTPRIITSTEEQGLTSEDSDEFPEVVFIAGSAAGLAIGVIFAAVSIWLVISYRKSKDKTRKNGSNSETNNNDKQTDTARHQYSNDNHHHGNDDNQKGHLHGNTNPHARENLYTEIEENNLIETIGVNPHRTAGPYYIEVLENGYQNRSFPDYLELINEEESGNDGMVSEG